MGKYSMTIDGRITMCCSPPDKIGKGRCNHVAQIKEGETIEQFQHRGQIIIKFNRTRQYWEKTSNEQIIRDFIVIRGVNHKIKAKLQNIDINQKYFYRKEIETYDEEDLKQILKDHKDEKNAYNTSYYQFIDEHPEMFFYSPTLKNYKEDEDTTKEIDEIVESYEDIDDLAIVFKESQKSLEKYNTYLKSNKENMTMKRFTKPEYKEAYQEAQQKIMEETGWMGDTYYKNLAKKRKGLKFTIKRNW